MAESVIDGMDEPITIDNFQARMSSFQAAKALYALVDMGSNGIRFSISDLTPPRSRALHCLYRDRAGISLYDALNSSGSQSFLQRTIDEVAGALARFKRICDAYGVAKDNINVFATEAMRTANNREQMVTAIHEASGLTMEILSPGVESLFGAMGARSGFHNVDGLFMDLGGGSVQMTYMNSSTPGYDITAAQAAQSMPFGAAKVTAAFKSQQSEQYVKIELRKRMKGTFDGLVARFHKLKEQAEHEDGVTIYFCGGGFRGYGSMLMHTDPIQPYPIPAIGGYTVSGHRFIKWREMLHANNTDERKIFGLSKRRREQFPAIAAVVQSLVEAVPKIKQVVFCSGGNREGVLYMKLPPEVRERNPFCDLPEQPASASNIDMMVNMIDSGLAGRAPVVFSKEILRYITQNCRVGMGQSSDSNSAKVLHNPISSDLSDLPGFTHEMKAVLALTMCARWGSDLGPADQQIFKNLQSLIGHDLSWWCNYVGALAKLITLVYPTYCAGLIPDSDSLVTVESVLSQNLGKGGHKHGIMLKIHLNENESVGVNHSNVQDLFSKVGKGLSTHWRIEVEVHLATS